MKRNDALKRELSRTPPKDPKEQCDNPDCGCKKESKDAPLAIRGDAKPTVRG